MPIDPTKLAALLSLSLTGKPACCAYWLVEWDPNNPAEDRYYSDSIYHQIPPFTTVGVVIEPRIIVAAGQTVASSTQFEINPDLRTETIPLVFDDIDKSIQAKFQTFKSGVQCELFFYYPDCGNGTDLTISMWFGQLQAPDVYGHKTVKTKATNGTRSREQLIPRRPRPRECTANFGAWMPTLFALESNGCPYDRHLGGVPGYHGINDPVTGLPFIDCPRRSVADCNARFGTSGGLSGAFYLGFDTDASATLTDQRSGHIAVSKGNESNLKNPIRVIAGQKYLRGLQPLLWRREPNANTPDHGFVRAIYETGEGPLYQLSNLIINEKLIELSQRSFHLGQKAQPRSGYASTVSNFSNTAHIMGVYGWVNPLNLTAADLHAECTAVGYREVAVFSTIEPGHGVMGNVYRNENFTDFAGVRYDPNFNFYGRLDDPVAGSRVHSFSIIWGETPGTLKIKPRYTGTYTFTLYHDDGAKLVIGGTTVIDQAAAGTHTGSIALTADVEYNLEARLVNALYTGDNYWSYQLKWSSTGAGTQQALEIVPASRLITTETLPAYSYGRQWTDSRSAWIQELYSNQRWGMGNPESKFEIPDWITVEQLGRDLVSFTALFADGETEVHSGQRTRFECAIESRPVAEQIEDICRSGALSIPFQHEGKYTITPFREATSGELAAARVFTDTGSTRNIFWNKEQPAIDLSQIPDDKVVNEIKLTFEEQSNKDVERPFTVDDPNQKLKAGRVLGEANLQPVPKSYAAFGIRYLQEVVRLGYRLLRFGQFDEGGTQNNLGAKFTTPFEQVLGIKRYEIIKIVSSLLDGFTIGTGATTETPEYFRVMKLKKVGDGLVEVIAQAYNHTAYTAFETVTAPGTGLPPSQPTTTGGGVPHTPQTPTCIPEFASPVTYDSVTGTITVSTNTC